MSAALASMSASSTATDTLSKSCPGVRGLAWFGGAGHNRRAQGLEAGSESGTQHVALIILAFLARIQCGTALFAVLLSLPAVWAGTRIAIARSRLKAIRTVRATRRARAIMSRRVGARVMLVRPGLMHPRRGCSARSQVRPGRAQLSVRHVCMPKA